MTHRSTHANRPDGPLGRPGARARARLLLLAVTFATAVAALAPAPALGRSVIATFGPNGTSGTSFADNYRLAFGHASRKLYALDIGAPGIYGFDASAPPAFPQLTGFTPLPTAPSSPDPGLAVDNTALASAGNIYYAAGGGKLYGFDSTGAPLGGNFPIDPATNPGAPDGSPKDICAAAVDSAGNLWVANFATDRVLRYSSAGVFLGSVSASGQLGQPCNVAFDSNDDMYVGMYQGATWRYTATSGYTAATMIDPALTWALAVDPTTDQLYVAHTAEVKVYSSGGSLQEVFATGIPGASFRGVAVDATNHHAYVSDLGNQEIRVFSAGPPSAEFSPASDLTNTTATLNGSVHPLGAALTDCRFDYVTETAFRLTGFTDLSSGGTEPCDPPAGSIPANSNTPVDAALTGLTRNTDYRFRLLATNANGTVTVEDAFTTTGPATVETTGSPIRTATTTQLQGRVNPRGAATTYHFEYVTDAAFKAGGFSDLNSGGSTAPRPAGPGQLIRLVSEEITGLQPDATYHYRVVADNGNPDGPATGEDTTVRTRASDAPLTHGHFPGPLGSDRAYEQVSLPDSGGNPVGRGVAFSDNGDRALYQVNGGTPISDSGSFEGFYFAQRSAGGWQSQTITAPRSEAAGRNWDPGGITADLSFVLARNSSPSLGIPPAFWRLDPAGEPTKLFQSSVVQSPGGMLGSLSADGTRAVALLEGEAADPAYPEAAAQPYFYDISAAGAPQLLSLLPGGAVPPCGVDTNPTAFSAELRQSHWLSADGSLVFFPSRGNATACGVGGPNPELYLRDLNAGTTTLISGPPVSGSASGAVFLKATPDAAFFWTRTSLDPQDSGGGDVYRYDLADETLDCVTCVVAGLDADVQINSLQVDGGLRRIAVADDGSRVYFTSATRLLPGAPSAGGAYRVALATGDLAYVGPGQVGEIATASGVAGGAINPDGSVLLFRSSDPGLNQLGGADNGGAAQYYRYDDRDRSLLCLSCPPDGSAPVAGVPLSLANGQTGAPNITPLSADGATVAFATPTALLAADQNTSGPGQEPRAGTDLYEWRDGRLLLVTDGLTNWPQTEGSQPVVSGISPSGRDLYFTAYAQYTPDALDGYSRLYDARIGGGFDFPVPPPPCPLEVCQGTPKGAPDDPFPGSLNFTGRGNVAEPPPARKCPRGKRKVRRAGKVRCVAKKHKRANKHRRANRDRRAHR